MDVYSIRTTFLYRTAADNFDVSYSSQLIDEQKLLQTLFTKANLSTILYFKGVQHSQVR
jgi:hypothetical protein